MRSANLILCGVVGGLTALMLASFGGCSYHQKRLDEIAPKRAAAVQSEVDLAKRANEAARREITAAHALFVANLESNHSAWLGELGARQMAAARGAEVTGDALDRTQRMVGLPAENQSELVSALLSTNATLRANAQQAVRDREALQQEMIIVQRANEAKLLEFGAKYEEERNKSILRRIYAYFGFFGTIAAVIALVIFCPPAAALMFRFVGWLVGKVPSVARAAGVVGKKAFDATVKGIGNARDEFKKMEALPKEQQRAITYAEARAIIDRHLKEATEVGNANFRKLIESTREQVNV